MLIRSEFCTDFLLAVSVSMGNTWWQSGGYCFEYFLKKSWKYEKNGLTWKGYSSWNWICVVVLSAQGTYSKRKRRAAPTRIRCRLALVADYRFFTEMGRGDTKQTINYMVSQSSHRHKNIFDFSKNVISLSCKKIMILMLMLIWLSHYWRTRWWRGKYGKVSNTLTYLDKILTSAAQSKQMCDLKNRKPGV